ncbi:MAG TPA: hypothetical protein VIK81_04190 [Patescibacteria group bacterium]
MKDERDDQENTTEYTEISISEMAERMAVEDKEQESQILSDLGIDQDNQDKSGYQSFQEQVIIEDPSFQVGVPQETKLDSTESVLVDIKSSRVGRSISSHNHPNFKNEEPANAGSWGKIVEIRAKLTTRGRQAVLQTKVEKTA